MEGGRSKERITRELELMAERLEAHESHCAKCKTGSCVEGDQLADLVIDLEDELDALPEVKAEFELLLHDLIEAQSMVDDEDEESQA